MLRRKPCLFASAVLFAALYSTPRSAQASVAGSQGVEIEGPMDRRGLFVGFGVTSGASYVQSRQMYGFGGVDFVIGGGVGKKFTLGLDLQFAPFFQSKPALMFGGDAEATFFPWRGLLLRLGLGARGFSRAPTDRESGVVGALGGKAGVGYEIFINATAALSLELAYDIRVIPGSAPNHAGLFALRFLWY